LDRRTFLHNTGGAAVAAALSSFPSGWVQATRAPRRRILFFTRSQGYEHSVVKRSGGKLAHAEQVLTDLGHTHGFDVTCTKDGSVFEPKSLANYDAFFFYTTGDLTKPAPDGSPPMTPEGKAAFLDAISRGTGFLGAHAATDTFLTAPDDRYTSYGSKVDPYIAMIGAEFIHHDNQQTARLRITDPKFPGFSGIGDGFNLNEEWYSMKDFAPNLHVLLVQETAGMVGPHYKRAPYPATWARAHGKGRVFYTSMGHREDVWTNPTFQSILLGGISWTVRNINANVTPNLSVATPGHSELPPKPETAAKT